MITSIVPTIKHRQVNGWCFPNRNICWKIIVTSCWKVLSIYNEDTIKYLQGNFQIQGGLNFNSETQNNTGHSQVIESGDHVLVEYFSGFIVQKPPKFWTLLLRIMFPLSQVGPIKCFAGFEVIQCNSQNSLFNNFRYPQICLTLPPR